MARIVRSTGRAVSGQRETLVIPPGYAFDGSKPLMSYQHGATGNGNTGTTWPQFKWLRWLANNYGIPSVTGDQDGAPATPGHSWANAASRTNSWDLIEWAATELNTNGRVFLVGGSMGFVLTCALLHDHPDDIDGVVGMVPVIALQETYETAEFNDGTMDDDARTAYGSEAAFYAALPTTSPAELASEFVGLPFALHNSLDDTSAPPTPVDSFAAILGASCEVTTSPTGGHNADLFVTADEVGRWIAERA